MGRKSSVPLDDIGLALEKRRSEMGKTQAEVAKIAGIDSGSYSHVVNGARRRFETVNKIFIAMGLSYDEIVLKMPHRESVCNGKVAGKIDRVFSVLSDIGAWMRENDNPEEMAIEILTLIKISYPNFREWIEKKRKEQGECGTSLYSKSANEW